MEKKRKARSPNRKSANGGRDAAAINYKRFRNRQIRENVIRREREIEEEVLETRMQNRQMETRPQNQKAGGQARFVETVE